MSIPSTVERRGLLLVISSPSGAGKTSLSRRLISEDPNLSLSISATTRPPRPSEVQGQDYHFMSEEAFLTEQARGNFLESAVVFGNRYGTPKAPVFDALHVGHDVLFDIDWQGKQQLDDAVEADVVSIFILPPSRAALAERLRKRSEDSEDVVARRMAAADQEISHYAEYQYVIVNDDFEKAFGELRAILAAERLRRTRQTGLRTFVDGIIAPGA
ncbi:MAG: guanylate kinase [Parvularcula sp.]|jgi:guanylate kinase|nr:guanylate kinase [Parvularcula sp.]